MQRKRAPTQSPADALEKFEWTICPYGTVTFTSLLRKEPKPTSSDVTHLQLPFAALTEQQGLPPQLNLKQLENSG